MNYFNYGPFAEDGGVALDESLARRAATGASSETRSVALQVATLLGRCLPIADLPELSYLRCFVTLAFEEASAIANRGTPSAEDLDYIAYLEREARAYGASAI